MDLPKTNSIPLQPLLDENGSKESIVDRMNSQYPEEFKRSQLTVLSDEEIVEKCESLLTQKIKEGEKQAYFQLGQVYFEMEDYVKAKRYFERAPSNDWQAQYQLGVIHFDELGLSKPDYKAGLQFMKAVATSGKQSAKHLLHGAQFNIGRAFFQGFGVPTDYQEAERWWILAADDGNPGACIRAQSMLGMYYSRQETLDLQKSAFWHSEACGNGNLESQGALGVMYFYGLGMKKNLESAFECLSEASQRGNVYAMGHMVAFYYQRKLFTKCVDMASRVSQLENPEDIGGETGCQANYIAKGISMACFYYARCLDKELGVKGHKDEAMKYYSRAYNFDPDTCAALQNLSTQGRI